MGPRTRGPRRREDRAPQARGGCALPFYDGKSGGFPSVRVRMDFRDPDAAGTFLYHCHLLEHEDGGMMGTIRVEPANAPPPQAHRAP